MKWRLRVLRGAPEHGFTITEVLVVMLIFSAVLSMVGAIMLSALESQRRTVSRTAELNQQRTGFERMTRAIREADPLLAASTTSVQVKTVEPTYTAVSTWSLVNTPGGVRQLELSEVRTPGGSIPTRVVISEVPLSAQGFTFEGETGMLSSPIDPDLVRVVTIDLTDPGAPSQGLFDSVQLRNQS